MMSTKLSNCVAAGRAIAQKVRLCRPLGRTHLLISRSHSTELAIAPQNIQSCAQAHGAEVKLDTRIQ
jgi:hypothetical protein